MSLYHHVSSLKLKNKAAYKKQVQYVCLFQVFAALYISSKSVSARTGGGVVKQKADRRRREGGG